MSISALVPFFGYVYLGSVVSPSNLWLETQGPFPCGYELYVYRAMAPSMCKCVHLTAARARKP